MSETVHPIRPLVRQEEIFAPRRTARPTVREWARHAVLFLLTALTAAWAGTMLSIPLGGIIEPEIPAPVSALDYLTFIPVYYAQAIGAVHAYALTHPLVIAQGWMFAASLLSILLAHEAGHYVACRRYGVDATLPFFIPMPPPVIAGTLGAARLAVAAFTLLVFLLCFEPFPVSISS